jgi:hypothetical protein
MDNTISVNDYIFNTQDPIRIISTKEELDFLSKYIDSDSKEARKTYVKVTEVDRVKFLNDNSQPIRILSYWKTTANLSKLDPKANEANLYNNISYIRTKLDFSNEEFKQSDAIKMLDKHLHVERKYSVLPLTCWLLPIKNSSNSFLALQSVLNEQELQSQAKNVDFEVTYDTSDKVTVPLEVLEQFYPQTLKSMELSIRKNIEKVREYKQAFINKASLEPIVPLKEYIPLREESFIYADTPNPTVLELKSEGDYKFIAGYLLNSDIQVLLEAGDKLSILEMLEQQNNPDYYNLFVTPKPLAYDNTYRNGDTYKLYIKIFKDLNLVPEVTWPIRDIEENIPPANLPVTNDNPLKQALEYYHRTGVAISYCWFKPNAIKKLKK